MEAKHNGKTLYHVQSLSGYTDEPMDYFIWADHFPTKQEVRQVIQEDFGDDDSWVDDIFDNHNVYTVYASEV